MVVLWVSHNFEVVVGAGESNGYLFHSLDQKPFLKQDLSILTLNNFSALIDNFAQMCKQYFSLFNIFIILPYHFCVQDKNVI